MRPLRSSLGRSTTETVVSMACSAPQRWIASVMYCLARSTGGFARFGVEPLQQVGRVVPRLAFDLPDQQLLGFVGGQAGDALELVLVLGDELLAFRRRRGRDGSRARRSAAVAAAQLLLEALDRRLPLGDARPRAGASVCSSAAACWRSARAWRSASIRMSCAFSFASSSASFLRVSASRSASRAMRSGLLFGAADGLGGDALAGSRPRRRYIAAPTMAVTTGGDDDLREIRQHA